MKQKKIIPLVILSLIVLGITSTYIIFFNAREIGKMEENNINTETLENITSDEEKDVDLQENEIVDDDNQNISEDILPETNSNDEFEKPSISNNSKNDVSVDNKSTFENSSNQNNNYDENKMNDNSSQNSQVVDIPKQNNPWDELNISEYDYYYSPAWTWQKVDFGIYLSETAKKCSNISECTTKCQEYGNQYIEEFDGGYRCHEVYSHSGNYLGEYFSYFQLES